MRRPSRAIKRPRLITRASKTAMIRRYEAAGFVPYGLKPRALKVDDQYNVTVLMVLSLSHVR